MKFKAYKYGEFLGIVELDLTYIKFLTRTSNCNSNTEITNLMVVEEGKENKFKEIK